MNWFAYFDSLLGKRDSRKIKNNTYAIRLSDGTIGLRLHNTYVVIYYPDGTEVLKSGGWETVTTQDRINNYSTARVFSQLAPGSKYTRWALFSATPEFVTPPKVQKCRTCKGIGYKVYPSYRDWQGNEVPESKYDCYRCKGTGSVDYGSRKVYPEFVSGMRIRQGEPV